MHSGVRLSEGERCEQSVVVKLICVIQYVVPVTVHVASIFIYRGITR